jgi:hypothetical protein
MGKFAGIKKETVIAAIRRSSGIISTIAARLGCNWRTAERLIWKWPDTVEAYQEEQEHVLDVAETKVIESIVNGDMPTTKWYLSKKGRHRGYDDEHKPESTGGEEGDQIRIVIDE